MIPEGSLLAWFVAASVRGTILMGLLLVLRFVFRRQIPAQVLAAAWIVVALVWLVPLAIPVHWSPFNFTPGLPRDEPVNATGIAPAIFHAWPGTPLKSAAVVATGSEGPVAPSARPAAPAALRLSGWLATLWLGTAGVLLAYRAFSIARFDWRLRRGATAPDVRLTRALRAAGAELGRRHLPQVVTTDLVSSPALCGVMRARLLFPTRLAGRLSASELRWVLLHELGHFQRRDLWTLNLLHLAAIIQWFNPFAWLAIGLGRHDAELACDEFVLGHAAGAEPGEYGGVLLKLLGTQRTMESLPAAVGIVENKRQLLGRFAMIMNFRPVSFRRAVTSVLLLGGFAVVGVTQESTAPAPAAPKAEPSPAAARPLNLNLAQISAQQAERLARIIEWEDNGKLALRALGEVGGVPIALVDVEGEPVLVIRNVGLMGLRVGEIDLAARQITFVTRKGKNRVLKLENPEDIVFPKVSSQWLLKPEALARRNENMRSDAAVPGALVLSWEKINREAKVTILLNYLRTGDLVQIIATPFDNGVSVTRGFLFQEQSTALNRERKERFIASLTPEQKAGFNSGAAPAIRFADPPDKIQQQVLAGKAVTAKREKVVENLTPAQKALYDEWIGPIQGKPAGAR